MKRTFAFGAATVQGTWPVQEDGFYADPVRGLFAVADGFGGRGGGDLAAKEALLSFRAERELPTTGDFPPELKRQRAAFAAAQTAIETRNAKAAVKGAASLVALQIFPNFLAISQCGTCSAFLFRQGNLRPLLLPQAPPRQEFQPLLADHALGLSEPLVESRWLPHEPADVLLLASGGVEWEQSAPFLAALSAHMPGENLAPIAQQLLENASLSAQGWNRTLVLVEC